MVDVDKIVTFGDDMVAKATNLDCSDGGKNAYEKAYFDHLEQLAYIKINGQLNNESYNSVID